MVNDVLKAAQPCVLTPALKLARAQKLYNDCVRGYGAKNCCIVQYTQDNPEGKQLTTFIALPTRIVERDDGVNVEKSFIVDGWARGGRQLPTVEIPASKFAGLSWITEKWDFAANLAPGNTVRDRVRFIVVEVGARSAAHERVYAHTGWRRKMCIRDRAPAVEQRFISAFANAAFCGLLSHYNAELVDVTGCEDCSEAEIEVKFANNRATCIEKNVTCLFYKSRCV